MDRLAYRFYFVLFELFFLLSCVPFVAGLVYLPADVAASSLGKLLVACLGTGVVVCLFGSIWMAAISTHRALNELDSPVEAVLFALNEARVRLAFLPFIGRYFGPRPGSDRPHSTEPR